VNLFVEKLDNALTGGHYMAAIKRPGLTQFTQPSGGAAVGRGFYTWFSNNKTYSVFGNSIYSGTTNIYNGLMVTSTGLCSFVETSAIAANKYLAVNDGVKMYLISTSDVVTVVASNFPATNVGSTIAFDGYILVGEKNGRIWNSNNEDPTTWGASNFISAQAFPDDLVALARQNDVVLAFGTMSTQMFYDAGNAAPGSFMGNLAQATLQVGCAGINTISQQENFVVWVSAAQNGGFAIQKLDGITALNKISTAPIERLLNAEGASIANAVGFSSRIAGHFFYILNLVSANRTFVYDIDQKFWTEWQTGASGQFLMCCAGQSTTNLPLIQHTTNGRIYSISPAVYQDDGSTITVLLQTSPMDFDSMNRKFMSRLELIGDRYSTTNPVSVAYTDNDYQSFSTSRTIDMVQNNTNWRAFGTRWGSFKRRAFQLTHTANQPLRLEAMDVDIQLGSG
jgi:hypothetical protein